MSIASRKPYVGESRDRVEGFHGKQLVYVSWDHHLLFAAPFLICVPPQMPFDEFVAGPLSALLQPDPDAAAIDWTQVQWRKANAPFQPDFDRSLADNGVGHKVQLRFHTPGLNQVCGAAAA
jgi:phenol hydroxylase P4 protein